MSLKKEVFVWKKQHKMALLREMLVVEPYQFKVGSKERGNGWTTVAENLNRTDKQFRVSARSVREKFAKLLEEWLKIERDESRASGIEGKEEDEFDLAMADIYSRIEEVKDGWAKDMEKENQEKEKAAQIRRKATERIGETSKRTSTETETGEANTTPTKRCRKSDVFHALTENMKLKIEERRQEKEQEQQAQLHLVQQQNEFFSQQQGVFLQFMKQQMDVQRDQLRLQQETQAQMLKFIADSKM